MLRKQLGGGGRTAYSRMMRIIADLPMPQWQSDKSMSDVRRKDYTQNQLIPTAMGVRGKTPRQFLTLRMSSLRRSTCLSSSLFALPTAIESNSHLSLSTADNNAKHTPRLCLLREAARQPRANLTVHKWHIGYADSWHSRFTAYTLCATDTCVQINFWGCDVQMQTSMGRSICWPLRCQTVVTRTFLQVLIFVDSLVSNQHVSYHV